MIHHKIAHQFQKTPHQTHWRVLISIFNQFFIYWFFQNFSKHKHNVLIHQIFLKNYNFIDKIYFTKTSYLTLGTYDLKTMLELGLSLLFL